MKARIRIERLVSLGNYENAKLGVEIEIDKPVTGGHVLDLADQVEEWVRLFRKRVRMQDELEGQERLLEHHQTQLETSTPEERKRFRTYIRQNKAVIKGIDKRLKEQALKW